MISILLVFALCMSFGLCMLLRPIAVVLLTVLLYGLSIWVRSTTNLIFHGLCVIGLPLLWNGRAMLCIHTAGYFLPHAFCCGCGTPPQS